MVLQPQHWNLEGQAKITVAYETIGIVVMAEGRVKWVVSVVCLEKTTGMHIEGGPSNSILRWLLSKPPSDSILCHHVQHIYCDSMASLVFGIVTSGCWNRKSSNCWIWNGHLLAALNVKLCSLDPAILVNLRHPLETITQRMPKVHRSTMVQIT